METAKRLFVAFKREVRTRNEEFFLRYLTVQTILNLRQFTKIIKWKMILFVDVWNEKPNLVTIAENEMSRMHLHHLHYKTESFGYETT